MPDLTEDHEIIQDLGLDPGLVNRTLEKINEPRSTPIDVARDLADILDIEDITAETLVMDWREPDWPIEYSQTFRVDDIDVYEDFMLDHRGYEPHFAGSLDDVHATWRINMRDSNVTGVSIFTELIEVNGTDLTDD